MSEDLRKDERIDASNLLYWCVKDDAGAVVQQGMGRTLNVSESGIRLESRKRIDAENALWLTIGFEDDLVEIPGKIENMTQTDDLYTFGIRFIELDERSRVILNQYVKVFLQQINGG